MMILLPHALPFLPLNHIYLQNLKSPSNAIFKHIGSCCCCCCCRGAALISRGVLSDCSSAVGWGAATPGWNSIRSLQLLSWQHNAAETIKLLPLLLQQQQRFS
jgi:hypothetical protein